MYGQLHKVMKSKAALWGITLGAIILFCVTATVAFGMNAGRNDAAKEPAEKIPSVQSEVNGLQVQNASSASAPAPDQLQGQSDNGKVSQPAAPATAAPNAGLDAGMGVTGAQGMTAAGGSAAATVGPASTGLSAQLQPSLTNTNVQAQLNSGNLNLNAQQASP